MFNFSWFKSSKEDIPQSTWNPITLTMEQPSSPAGPSQEVVVTKPACIPPAINSHTLRDITRKRLANKSGPPRNKCKSACEVVEMTVADHFLTGVLVITVFAVNSLLLGIQF
ncbi:hypothetical protein EYZ11_005172 [Aspergillus tanneri]|uniref:Uncharacterized protein n=1 Tax=Aspergillus tanneri TaxID=1220188 RepID=A0A4S3JL24_9EURO|nr:hypothetical protein EYZ11_005172 [Aspergillus tanneri]